MRGWRGRNEKSFADSGFRRVTTRPTTGFLTGFTEPVWNTSHLLPMNSTVGTLLHALIGYEAQPFGMQVGFYVGGALLILAGARLARPQ